MFYKVTSLLVDVCTAYKVKVQKIEIFMVSESVTHTHSKPFSKRFYRFVVYLLIDYIDWLFRQCSFIRQLFVRCVIIDRCEWTLTQQFSLSLCFEWFHWWEMSVSFCCEKDKCPINFVWLWAFKRTNLLTILCDSGHLSRRYPYGCTPLCWGPKKKKKKIKLSKNTVMTSEYVLWCSVACVQSVHCHRKYVCW